jgi:hypothetical protein
MVLVKVFIDQELVCITLIGTVFGGALVKDKVTEPLTV